MISVIIATRNRPKKIKTCLESILKNRDVILEIVVIDQSDTKKTQELISQLADKKIKYIHFPRIGKSRALNVGIRISKGNILAFTDDDCLPSRRWAELISSGFKKHPKISGIFGNIYPHNHLQHSKEFCPSTFTKNKLKTISKECIHYIDIGYGNNMAFRKKALEKIGGFKEWLGPGSLGKNAEDADCANRILISGGLILHDPKLRVTHNKWLKGRAEIDDQKLLYTQGEMASYGYFHFQGYEFASGIVKENLSDSFYKLKKLSKNLLMFRWHENDLNNIQFDIHQLLGRIKGLLIGYIFSKIDPINQ